MNKEIGSAGLELIKSFESLSLTSYMPTPNDVPTIGYGHTGNVSFGLEITEQQALELLKADCNVAERCINTKVRVPLNQNQFDALVSFVFNVGTGAFSSSTMLKLLNAWKYKEAASQFARWNKQAGRELKGLTRRRAAERELFLLDTE